MRYEAYMDGVALSSLDSDLIILDIQHKAPDYKYSTGNIANRKGNTVFGESIPGAMVTILFELHIYDIADRQEAMQAVQRWAMGKILKTNDRDGQQLTVRCTRFPSITSALQWTEELEMTFTAFERPFWEASTAAAVTLTVGTSGSGTLTVPGNLDGAYIEAEVTAKASVTEFALSANGKTITLSGLSLENGQIVKILYDDRMIQSIKVSSTSLLNKRSGADDLLSVVGANTVSFTSDANVEVKFMSKGAWL